MRGWADLWRVWLWNTVLSYRLTKRKTDKSEEEFLKWLSPCPHLKHHLDAGEDILENTGGWLFESNSEFQRWEASTGSAVLWLTGSCKKTTGSKLRDAYTEVSGRREN